MISPKLLILSLVTSSLLFSDFTEEQTKDEKEVQDLIKEYTKYKDEVAADIEIVKTGKVEDLPAVKQAMKKPNINKTIDLLVNKADENEKITNSDSWQYLTRWFMLADQVSYDDENTLFYLINDSDFESKLADIEELSFDENYVPNDELISALKKSKKEYIEYLKSLVEDFGDIDSRFYEKLSFKVTARNGLSIRENPLTGLELQRTGKMTKATNVRVRYFINGADKTFNGVFNYQWAKVEISTKEGKVLGWASMKYLQKK